MINKLKKIILLVVLLIVALFFGKTTPVASQSPEKYVPDQIIVKFKATTDKNEQSKLHTEIGGVVQNEIGKSGALLVKIASGRVDEKIKAYKNNSQILYAEPNFIVKALEVPNDTYFGNQWYHNNTGQSGGAADADIDLVEAWQNNNLSFPNSVKIAILDTGIDQDHEDLAAKIDLNSNFSSSNTVDDRHGHGTHTAGIAAAITNNSKGIVGTGYANTIRLFNGKVLDDEGVGYYTSVADGIYWATDNGAKVISMSFGGEGNSFILKDAIDYAAGRGVVLVAAIGNNNNDSFIYPAAYNNVISVAATTNTDAKASFSGYGSWVKVAAPGENIFSTFPNHDFRLGRGRGRSSNSYGYGSGTSMSTPIVSGLAALIISRENATRQEVWDKIKSSSDPVFGNCGGVSCWQWGRVNVCNALGGACTYDLIRPTPSPIEEPVPTPILTPLPKPTPSPMKEPAPIPPPTKEPVPKPLPILPPNPEKIIIKKNSSLFIRDEQYISSNVLSVTENINQEEPGFIFSSY